MKIVKNIQPGGAELGDDDGDSPYTGRLASLISLHFGLGILGLLISPDGSWLKYSCTFVCCASIVAAYFGCPRKAVP